VDAPQYRSKHDTYNGHLILPSTRFPAQNVAVFHLAWSRNNGQGICIYFTIILYKNTQTKTTQYVCTLDHPVLKKPKHTPLKKQHIMYLLHNILYKNSQTQATQYGFTLQHPV